MPPPTVHLVLDVGNTRTKAALFREGRVLRWGTLASLPDFLKEDRPSAIVLGSVGAEDEAFRTRLETLAPLLEVTGATATPLRSAYASPSTLGADRLANAVGGAALFPGRNVLVIDVGTCITYDLVTAERQYLGGAITPGVTMRAKAMNAYSARLPEVTLTDVPAPWGTTTEASLASGIHHGITSEMAGFIRATAYEHERPAVVITGGDALRFVRALKSGIFADPLLTLRGLHAILQHHSPLDRPFRSP